MGGDLGASQNQEFGYGAQAISSLAVNLQLADRSCRQIIRNLMGLL
jgi:hypothetical protein